MVLTTIVDVGATGMTSGTILLDSKAFATRDIVELWKIGILKTTLSTY